MPSCCRPLSSAEVSAPRLVLVKRRSASAPGVYSICSSSDFRPGKCQLLVVREDWQAKGLVVQEQFF